MPREVSAAELRDRLAAPSPPAVLDVRDEWELDAAAFPGALHVPMADMHDAVERLPRDREVVVVCHHGGRSFTVAAMLERSGVNAVNLAGGIDAWARDIDPTVPRY